ncbi:MAG: ComEA family DNA-binding protein [Desulfuromonadaceae bacterium]
MNRSTKSALIAIALLLSAGLGFATDAPATDVKGTAKAAGNSVKADAKADTGTLQQDVKGKATDGKSAVKAKIVDINTATTAELKAIPGIGDAYSEKIIAGRPYANKAQLKSRNILPVTVYEQVKELIIAKAVKK